MSRFPTVGSSGVYLSREGLMAISATRGLGGRVDGRFSKIAGEFVIDDMIGYDMI